jgi:hypothetical protein
VDLWEINEAFAVVPMALMAELKVPHDKVNVNGGACALGHPIGASGARIMVTLMHALQARGKKKGLATLCIGGGEATAMAIELARSSPPQRSSPPGTACREAGRGYATGGVPKLPLQRRARTPGNAPLKR